MSAEPGLSPAPLPPGFYNRPAEQVARDLLGVRLVSNVDGVRCAAEILETEAYVGPHDEASHAHIRFGRTPRNEVMFGPAGHAYIYRIYGIHWCANVVTGADGYPAAVLIRAGKLLEGDDIVQLRRGDRPDRELLRGPGNLARALGLDGSLNGHPVDRPPLWLEAGAVLPDEAVAVGPRIGITRAAEWPLRFWVRGNRWVSGPSG